MARRLETKGTFLARRFPGIDFSKASLTGAVYPATVNPLEEDFPVITQSEQIVTTIESVIKGEVIDWASSKAIDQATEQAVNLHRIFGRTIYAMLKHPSRQSRIAFELLTQDLEKFSPDASRPQSEQFSEWFSKAVILGGECFYLLEKYHKMLKKRSPRPYIERYKEAIKKQADFFAENLSKLELKDLTYFVAFSDMFKSHMNNLQAHLRVKSGSKISSVIVAVEDGEEKEEETTFPYGWDRVFEAENKIRKKIYSNWEYEEVREALRIFPKIKSDYVTGKLLGAVESNLSRLSKEQNKDVNTLFKEEGIIYAISGCFNMGWQRIPAGISRDFPDLAKTLDSNLEAPGFSVPRKYLPSLSLLLLSELQRAKPEAFTEKLAEIQEIREESGEVRPWFIALLYLRAANPKLKEPIDKLIEEMQLLPEAVRETALDKKAGGLLLSPKGKIFTASSNKETEEVFPLYTSSYSQPAKVEPAVIYEPTKEAGYKEIATVPLFKSVAIIKDESVPHFIKQMFNQNSLDENSLLSYFETKSRFWRTPTQNFIEVIFPAEGNPFNPLIKQAEKFGIRAIYIKGDEVIFVTDEALREGRISLKGKINDSGELELEGMDRSFVGDKEHIFLNVLALDCATTSTTDINATQIKDPSFKIAVMAASSWNRNLSLRSKGLPKVEIPKLGEQGQIAMQGDKNEPFLLVEKA